MFWNAALLPLVTFFNLATAVLIRRYFVLDSGLYDVLLGVVNTLLAYTAVGLPACFPQFLPRLELDGNRSAVTTFIYRAAGSRLALLGLALVPFNLLAEPLAERLSLGDDGVLLLHLLSGLVLLRAANDLLVKSLQALLAQLAANLLQFAQAFLVALALAFTFAAGRGMPTLVGALITVAAVILIIGTRLLVRAVASVPDHGVPAEGREAGARFSPGVRSTRLWRFAAFMYVFDLSSYFAVPAFASTALASATGDMAQVALFNVGFQFPIMVVVVVLAGFQGLYRPMFSALFSDGDPVRIRTAFREVTKVQAILLIPAAAGLAVMVGDYIPLLFGVEFVPAVPIAQILCALLFAESLFNLGYIMLSVDHRYGLALGAQALRVLPAPAFVVLAAQGHLLLASTVFGAGRLAATVVGYLIARRLYGLRFPLGFVGRLAVPSAIMAATVALARVPFETSWTQAIATTLLGVAVVLVGLRAFRVLGPREIELLNRTQLPGKALFIAWLSGDK